MREFKEFRESFSPVVLIKHESKLPDQFGWWATPRSPINIAQGFNLETSKIVILQ